MTFYMCFHDDSGVTFVRRVADAHDAGPGCV
jgi:hypothetical protein